MDGRRRFADLGEFIREQRRAARLSLRKLSDLAGISNPYLSQIERGLRKPSAEILQAIAKGLRISAETLYVRAGILDEDRDHDLVGEILRDPAISERQKQVLIDIYRSFRGAPDEPHRRAASVAKTSRQEDPAPPGGFEPSKEGPAPPGEAAKRSTGLDGTGRPNATGGSGE
jgi:transcriptional regulator with XRE-family HTH domain